MRLKTFVTATMLISLCAECGQAIAQDKNLSIQKNDKSKIVEVALNATVTAKQVEKLEAIDNLFGLDLSFVDVSDAHLNSLWKVENIEDLNLDAMLFDSKLSDAGLLGISRWKNLEILNLEYCSQITSDGIKLVSEIQTLRQLRLDKTGIGNEAIAHLANLPDLNSLSVQMTDIDDDSVKLLLNLKGLRYLNVNRTKISLSGLKKLAKMLSKECSLSVSHEHEDEIAKIRE